MLRAFLLISIILLAPNWVAAPRPLQGTDEEETTKPKKDYTRFLTDEWKGTFSYTATIKPGSVMPDSIPGMESVETGDYSLTGTVKLHRAPEKEQGQEKVWEGTAEGSLTYAYHYSWKDKSAECWPPGAEATDANRVRYTHVYADGTVTGSGPVRGSATLKIDMDTGNYDLTADLGVPRLAVNYTFVCPEMTACPPPMCNESKTVPASSIPWDLERVDTPIKDVEQGMSVGEGGGGGDGGYFGASGQLPAEGRFLTTKDGKETDAADIAVDKELAKAGQLNETENWSLSPGDVPDWEVIVEPDKYDTWLPEGGKDEKTQGNSIKIVARIEWPGKKSAPREKASKFTFELTDVSRQPGVCMNWPPKNKATTDADLQFASKQPDNIAPIDPTQKEILKVETKEVGMPGAPPDGYTEASVDVSSYDWGAWGTLKVTAELPGGRKIEGHLKGKDAFSTTILLPKRRTDSHIGDLWLQNRGVSGLADDSDEDDLPRGDGDRGDGLSLYEEYRGFSIQGHVERTDPKKKDLFIYKVSLPEAGVLLFAKESGLLVHLIRKDEFYEEGDSDKTRNHNIINFNHDWAHLKGDQHVLWLMDHSLPSDGAYGNAFGSGPGVPKTVYRVAVDKDKCLAQGTIWKDPGFLASITAHELGHGVNLPHHGNTDLLQFEDAYYTNPDNTKGKPVGGGVDVAVPGGQESGVEQCIMRYNVAQLYECNVHPEDAPLLFDDKGTIVYLRNYRDQNSLPEKRGTIFCDSSLGTGVNDKDRKPCPKAGNARNGDCLSRICVNDLKH